MVEGRTIPYLSKVHAEGCGDYGGAEVGQAVARIFVAFDPGGEIFSPGSRVLIKPNLLRPSPPESAINTHPAVIVECVRFLRGRGCSVLVADSPGVGSGRGNLRRLGCLRELDALGAEARGLSGPRSTMLPCGKRVGISADALDADAILSIPKWKTHVQVGITAAVKNLFGCIVGPRKAWQHVAYGHVEEDFLSMLLDLSAVLRPALTIVDGVVAMEGNGPFHGSPKRVGYMFAGRDPVAIDRVLASLMGFGELGMFRVAKARSAGECDISKIGLSGAKLPDRILPPFRLPDRRPLTFNPLRRVISGRCEPWDTVPEIHGPLS